MNLKTTYTLALLVIVGGLLLLLVQPWKKDDGKKGDVDSNDRALVEKPPAIEDVDRLEVKTPSEAKTVFVRGDDDRWRIVEPIDAPALSFPIRTAITKLTELTYDKAYRKKDKGRPSDEEAGTGASAMVVTMHDAKNNRTLSYRIGGNAPLSENTYVRVEGDDTVYEVGEQIAEPVDKTYNDFRDKNLLSDLLADQIQRIRVEGIEGYEIALTDDGWKIEQPIRARALKAKAEGMAVAARSLSAKKFVDDDPTSLTKYGLESPSLRITVTAMRESKPKDGDENAEPTKEPITRTILIGGQAGQNYFAKLADQPWVFTIADSARTQLAVPLSDIRDTQLLDIAKADVTAVEITRDGNMSRLSREEGIWKLPDGTDADSAAVEDLLNEARALKATRFVDDTGLTDPGLDPPATIVRFVLSGVETPQELEIGGKSASGAMIFVRNPATESIAVVREAELANLQRPPVAYRSRDVLSYNMALTDRLEIVRDGETWVLNKADKDWRISEPITADADHDGVKIILADMSSLRGRSIAGIGNADAFGLDNPEVVVKLRYQPLPMPVEPTDDATDDASESDTDDASDDAESDDDASTEAPGTEWVDQDPVSHVLRFAEHDGAVYANIDETGVVYEVDRAILDNLKVELINRHIAPVEPSQIVGMVFETNERRLQLNRIGDTWTYTDDPTLPIGLKKIERVLNGITDLKTEKYVDLDPGDLVQYGLDEPAVRVMLTLDDHSAVEILVSGDGPEERDAKYAWTSTFGRVYLLTVSQVGVLTVNMDDVAAPPPKPNAPAQR